MVQFIADHRAVFGVEPICAVLPIVKGGPKLDQSGGGKLDHPAARWRV